MNHLQVPPHSVEAEQSVLGGIMLDNNRWLDVQGVLTEEDFYRRDHRLIWRAIAALRKKEEPCDAVTVSEMLEEMGENEAAGGLAYTGTLARDTPSAANVTAYARIVRERAIRRRLIRTGNEITVQGFGHNDLEETLEWARSELVSLDENPSGDEAKPIGHDLMGWLDNLDRRATEGEVLVGVSSGFKDLDDKTAGLEDGDLIILAGRPSMGKTALALNMASSQMSENNPVLLFSLEMTRSQLIGRIAAAEAQINYSRVRKATLTDEEWSALTKATARVNEWPLIIDDTPGLTVAQMMARARRIQHRHGLSMVMVDHIQIVRGEGSNRTETLTDISHGLKQMAKALSVPNVVLCQLNRTVETRPDKRPRLSDLRESGAIEQDADMVLFLYRHSYYHEDFGYPGVAELLIEKQRNGPLGRVLLSYSGVFQKFRDLDKASISEYMKVITRDEISVDMDSDGLGATSRRRRRSSA